MNEQTLKLFQENYENKGLCNGLDKMVKTFTKEFKKSNTTKTIQYLPWAVSERIFRMQGGSIEVVDWKYGVAFDSQEYNAERGEIEQGARNALFVHLKGTWQGETLDEFYPIFDNQSSKVIRTPDAQELNTSRQRGSVRLIARLTGIGLWIFEQQDNQFGDDSGEEEVIVAKKVEDKEDKKETTTTTKGNKKSNKEETKAKEKQDKDDAMNDALGVEKSIEEQREEEANVNNMLLGKAVSAIEENDNKETLTQPETPKENDDYAIGTEQHSDMLLKVKAFVKVEGKREMIIAFKGDKLLGHLSYKQLKELLAKLEE